LDENSSNILSPLQIKNVLKEVYENSLNQQKLELINFDNCLMANVENICAISPYTKNIIANEEKGFFKKELPLTTGFDYASIFEYISKFSTTKSEIIGKYIVDRYANFQSQANLRYVTSSIETKKIGKLNEELENFFLGSSDSNIDLWKQTARDSEKFDNNTIDLYN
jgi:hypothetical protein